VRRLPWLAAALLAAVPLSLPAQPPGKSPVLLFVTVPSDAKLTVNGSPTSQTGPERRLISPPIAIGEKGTYTLAVTYAKDGKTVTVERTIVVTGGEESRVDLTKDEPKAGLPVDPKTTIPDVPKVEPKKTPEVPKVEPKVTPKVDTPPPPPKVDTPAKKDPKLDVPFVPTPQEMVDKMLDVAGVKDGDVVYDLGSGDGRIVITAVQKYGAKKGVGIEKSADRVKLSKDNAEKAGVAAKAEFREGDVLKLKDVSEATVVTLQLLPDVNEKLKPVLRKTLKPGARVVSFDFDMGDDWKPDREVTVKDPAGREHTIYLWTIKAAKKRTDVPPPFDKPDPKPAPKTEPKKAEPKEEKNPIRLDAPYVPTAQTVVDEMLKFAGVKAGDVVYDLGCGDGRIVVTAVKDFKAKKGVGIDLDPKRVEESKENAKAAKVEDKVEFREGDILKLTDLPDATVVTLYLFPEVNAKLAPMLKKLKPGTRIVSHDFLMAEYPWKPEKQTTVKDAGGTAHDLFLWVVK
jgi:uncharacterized protein (TIGR03000 family)